MKVILQQDVRDHGKKGQLVDVSDGYARNFLIPRKLAVAATAGNLNLMKRQEAAKKRRAELERAEALEAAKKLEGVVVKIAERSGASGQLFGSVTAAKISEALAAQHGIVIEKNKLALADNLKSYGPFEVRAKLGHEVTGTVNVLVVEG